MRQRGGPLPSRRRLLCLRALLRVLPVRAHPNGDEDRERE
jgi:hypothetical protein